MAISIDTSLSLAYSGSGVTSYTRSFTTSGTERYLLVYINDFSGNNQTGCTYNGTSMTLLNTPIMVGSIYQYVYGLANPASGAHDIVYSRSSSTSIIGMSAVSINGAKQTTSPVDAVNTATAGSVTSLDINLTTIADNSAVFVFSYTNNANIAASTNLTEVVGDSGFDLGIICRSTTFPKTPAGLQTYTTTASSGDMGSIAVSIAPPGGLNTVKTWDNIAIANVKTVNGVAIGNVKSINGKT